MNELEFRQRLFDRIQSFSQVKIGPINSDTLLFSTGLIDSLTIVEIIVLVEECWDIQVDPSDLSMDNFDSIAAITGYVLRKCRGET
jgi:acyl carrier protein